MNKNNNKYMIVTGVDGNEFKYMMGYEKDGGVGTLSEVIVEKYIDDTNNCVSKRARKDGAELFGTRAKAQAAIDEVMEDIQKHITDENPHDYLQFDAVRFADEARIVPVVNA